MSLLVVGSVALDSVETPVSKRDDVLGGSAVFFSYTASYFTPSRIVGVVGDDWPGAHTAMLQARGIDTAGLVVVPGGKTFRWSGKYLPNMNDRETLETHLNVFEHFQPQLSGDLRSSRFVFLGNIAPQLQLNVLDQAERPELVVADTMDLWIRIQRDELLALFKRIDGVVLNDSEAKLLTGEENLVRAGRKVLELGPKFVVVKKGEHGAMFFSRSETYVLPAYPTPRVVDPTGAGDSFAGGMMGYLTERGNGDPQSLKSALAHGIVTASFTVEDFSLDRLQQITRADIDRRVVEYRQMLTF